MADSNGTPEDKQPVTCEEDVDEPAAHAQKKQEETHQQTEEQMGDSQGRRTSKFRHRRQYVQTDN